MHIEAWEQVLVHTAVRHRVTCVASWPPRMEVQSRAARSRPCSRPCSQPRSRPTRPCPPCPSALCRRLSFQECDGNVTVRRGQHWFLFKPSSVHGVDIPPSRPSVGRRWGCFQCEAARNKPACNSCPGGVDIDFHFSGVNAQEHDVREHLVF